MARVTVEDCSRKIDDRFRLAALAAKAAKHINSRVETSGVAVEKIDKPSVRALRQIASGAVSAAYLESQLIDSLRTKSRVEPISTDNENEDVVEAFDYLPGGADLYIGEDYSDLNSQIFIDDLDDDKKF